MSQVYTISSLNIYFLKNHTKSLWLVEGVPYKIILNKRLVVIMNNKKYRSDMDPEDHVGRLNFLVSSNIYYCILVSVTYIITSVY